MKTKPQLMLEYIEEHGPSTAAELAKHAGVPSGTVGGHLQTLMKKDVICICKTERPAVYMKRGYPHKPQQHPPPTLKLIMEAPAAVIPPKAPVSLDEAIESLAMALVGRISEVVEDKVATLIENIVADRVADSITKLTTTLTKPDPLPQTKPTLPKVLVCGLLHDQEQMIRKEFSDCLDVRFVGSNDNPSVWKSRATHVDRIFVMTSFVSHTHIYALESCGVKQNIQLISNGMSTLRDAMTKYYTEVV